MAPATKNITIPIGGTFSLRFLIRDADGFSFDLTGYTVEGQIRETAGSRKTICDMTGTVNDAATGDFSLEIATSDSALLRAGVYYWDCKLSSAALTLFPIAGKATVIQTGTR